MFYIDTHLAVVQPMYRGIRASDSWQQIVTLLESKGFDLVPLKDDILAVHESDTIVFKLGNCGHFFEYLIERLGMPPKHLVPTQYL